MMQSIEFQQINKHGIPLYFRHWPVVGAKAVVCLVHGMGEHSGRYDHVANFYAKNGIASIGFDHQGHGQTPGKRGHSEGLDSMLSDISILLEQGKLHYPSLPIFLHGHSMGGNLALNFLFRKNPELAGIIATAPWIRLPNPPSPLLIAFAKLLCKIVPKHTQSNALDVNGISNDPKVIAAYQADPLVHDRVSVKLGVELYNAANWLNKYKGGTNCPLLLMHGANDPITSPEATLELSKRLKGNVTLKHWHGLKHEIHNEPQQAEVLAYLVEWMGRYL